MVCTGAKNEEESKNAARKYARMIQKLGFKVEFNSFKIENIVGSSNVRFPIDLEYIYNHHQSSCSYEPEIFPGLIFRMIEPKIVLLIFVSGKLVLTGAKRKEDIDNAFKRIYPLLKQAQKKNLPINPLN